MKSIIEKVNTEIEGLYTVTIKSDAVVHLDDYELGEGELRNSYDNDTKEFSSTQETLVEDIQTNLTSYIEDTLYATFDETAIKEQLEDESEYHFWVSAFVDIDNTEPSDDQIENWKNGNEELFIQDNDIQISINGKAISNGLLADILFKEDA